MPGRLLLGCRVMLRRTLYCASKQGIRGASAIREEWTKVLRRGDQALRARLAKAASAGPGQSAPEAPTLAAGPEHASAEVASAVIPAEAANADAVNVEPAGAEPSTGEPDVVETATPPDAVPSTGLLAATLAESSDGPGAVPQPLPNIFAQLTVGDRIIQPLTYRDRTLRIAVILILVLALSSAVATIRLSDDPPDQQASQDQEKRGQVEKSETITVELVEAPDAASRSKVSLAGEDAPVAPPPPVEPKEPAPPGPPEPEDKKAEPEKKPQQKAEKPEQKPLTVDDFDVSMADYAKAIDEAQAERQRRKTEPPRSAQASRLAGAAPEGKQSPYVKAVLAVVAKNKPQLYITKGEVYVQFVLTRAGQIGALKVVQSSGDPLLDQIALNAIKVLKFPAPPADVNPSDLNYLIHYVMH